MGSCHLLSILSDRPAKRLFLSTHRSHHVSSCDERMSYVLCLQLVLTLWAGRVTVTINVLPDDVLLIIFLFDRLTFLDGRGGRTWGQHWRWQRLVHVCRRWRSLTFSSPKFLDLKLTCLPNTRGAHTYLATFSNRRKEPDDVVYARRLRL
jgi:hypothetical protein